MNPDGSKSLSSGRAANDDRTPITVYDPTYFSPESTQTHGATSTENTDNKDVVTELPTEETHFRPATAQERFAAFFADTLIFAPIALTTAFALEKILKKPPSAMILGLTATGLYLLYYLLTEAFLAASPGKMLAGLRIRRTEGGAPSFLEVTIRNLARLIDYPLFFITVAGVMEATHRFQRLGDLAAGTMVVRDVAFEPKRIPETTPLAGTTRRAIAWALDLGFFVLPFFYGLLLLAPSDKPALQSLIVAIALPFTLLLLTFSETLFQATPGKALLGLKVAQEDGRPARFATLWLRNVFKIFDANPLGYLCIFLSSRKQRPGDAAAGTLVFYDRRSWKSWLSFPFLGALAFLAATAGLKNTDSFLRRNSPLQIGAYAFDPVPAVVKRLPFLRLGILIEELKLGVNDQEENPSKTFTPGQPIYLLFRLSGYLVQADKAWIQADIKVKDPHGTVVLDRMNVINSSLPVGSRRSAKLITRFALNPQAETGPYQVTLKIRDMFGGRYVDRIEAFSVH